MCISAFPEAQTFKALSGSDIPGVDFFYPEGIKAQIFSALDQCGNHGFADAFAPAGRVTDDNGQVLSPESHIADGFPWAIV